MGRNKDDNWTKNFKLLKKYKEEFGNCNVPTKLKYKGVKLGAWVSRQREVHRGHIIGLMDQERIDKLNSIGFIWKKIK